MRKLFFLILLFSVNFINAQSSIDTTIKADLLKAPASPASTLLGIATSDIDKPTDVSAFMTSLQSSTNSFTKFPSSYAFDIAPYWLFKNSKKGDITTEGFRKSTGKDVFKQSLVFSFAFRSTDTTETLLSANSAYGGFGFKFSILRGDYDATTNDALNKIKKLQDIKLRHLDDVMTHYRENTDPEIIELGQRRKDLFKGIDAAKTDSIRNSKAFKDITDSLSSRLKKFAELEKTDRIAELDNRIQEVASTFQTARVGWTWDIAGGISTEFKNKRFDNSRINNTGIWTVIGYTDTVYGAGLLLLRLLNNPDKIFAKGNAVNQMGNITTFDAGMRYIYSKPQSKFNASVEAIYRSVLSSNTISPSWRLVFNADYSIWQNQKLAFSFGRNFDGTITKDGNLIAALSFLTGFGNKR